VSPVGDEAAAILAFAAIPWADEYEGARRKRMATGQAGFYMNHSEMPPGFTVPLHTHDHDELITVLTGGCTLLGGGPALGPRDAVVLRAGHEYGFTCGPEGMTFLTIRTGEAATSFSA
jgi:quercetin dioxygenase-like cupin family protein